MTYTDNAFLVLFLVLTIVGRLLHRFGTPGVQIKEMILTAVSWLLILSWGTFDFVLFMAVTMLNFGFALAISKADAKNASRLLRLAIVADIAILACFKYGHFFVSSLLGISTANTGLFSFGIPLAISFYSFHIIGYLADLKKGRVNRLSLRDYLFYLGFFPHVVAGPIIRAWQFAPQLGQISRRKNDVVMGIHFFVVGYALKTLVANNIGAAIDPYWEADGAVKLVSAADHWVAAFLYYCQIYSDFAGYSLMASGMARMLGYKFPCNFRSPMIAASLREFWQRWHITLSRWLRDYLYIPLGGSRGTAARTSVNLMLTMLLGGLWHGANWTFIVWGGLHGLGLVIARWMPASDLRQPLLDRIVRVLVTQSWVLVAWVFFRSPTVDSAFGFVGHMFDFGQGALHLSQPLWLLLPFALLPLAHNLLPLLLWRIPTSQLGRLQGAMTGILLVCGALVYSATKPFIYFRF